MKTAENPFIIAGRIPASLFCDRVAETERLVGCILNHENVVLFSPRRMGKSELVNHCFDQPEVSRHAITISIDILPTTSLNELVRQLGSAVFRQVASRSEQMFKAFTAAMKTLHGSFGFDPIRNTPTFDIKLGDIQQPEYTLEEIFDYINHANQRCVICIDEFQQISKYPEKNVEALLRSHVQRCTNANFIFAGSQRHLMNAMFLEANRPFYQSATLLELHPIDLGVYTEFVEKHFSNGGRHIAPDIISHVYNTFDGVTFYVQRIFHDLYAETVKGEKIGMEKADFLINRYIAECSTQLREQLSFVSQQQKEVLFAISHEGVAERVTSGAFIKRHSLKSPSAVQSALKRLLDFDMVTESERKYTIADPVLRLWLEQNR
ncbi:MAG: ATP-binding protein [Prevotella sp.]|nr:ATP-binding protein [Prevotella sp.]